MLRSLLFFTVLFTAYVFNTQLSNAGVEVPGACCSNYPTGDCVVTESGPACGDIDGEAFLEGLTCEPNPCDDPADGTGSCCESQTESDTTGCNDSECELTVCQEDAFCCLSVWDELCQSEAEELCGNLCSAESPGPAVVVPTMNQWGIIFTSILLGVIGIFVIRREENLQEF